MQCHDNFKQTTALLRTKHLLQRHWILTPLATTLPSTSPPKSRQRPDQKSEAPIQKCEASIQKCEAQLAIANLRWLMKNISPHTKLAKYSPNEDQGRMGCCQETIRKCNVNIRGIFRKWHVTAILTSFQNWIKNDDMYKAGLKIWFIAIICS